MYFVFFSSRRRHTRYWRDWSSDVCSSDLNWCPSCGTALADDEVDHEESHGHLWHLKYPVKDSDECIIIATSRPETMLADVAVVGNLEDEKKRHMIGQIFVLVLGGREVLVILDEYVGREY